MKQRIANSKNSGAADVVLERRLDCGLWSPLQTADQATINGGKVLFELHVHSKFTLLARHLYHDHNFNPLTLS